MSWQRRWRISSREKWRVILQALLDMNVNFSEHPVEMIVREERVEKTDAQRRLFHAVCGDLAPYLGLTPKAAKMQVKAEFYGVEVVDQDGVIVGVVPSSEDSDREEYGRLIDFAYQLAAERGIYLADRRTK